MRTSSKPLLYINIALQLLHYNFSCVTFTSPSAALNVIFIMNMIIVCRNIYVTFIMK